MLGKIVIILLIGALFYMILAGKCSSGSKQSFMPYLPSGEMCDMTPEYWPEECSQRKPLKEKCCGATPHTGRLSKLRENCCGAPRPDPPRRRENCCGMV